MQRCALAAALVAFISGGPALAQATLGTPRAAAELARPVASSSNYRASADDTPTLNVPEPAYPQSAYPPVAYPPSSSYPPPGAYAPYGAGSPYSSLPYPNVTDPMPSMKGDPVRRTSFSSRSASSTSHFGDDAHGCFDDCCEYMKNCFTADGRTLFQSDHSFDNVFVSPITNPFLFEDPRSLTEVRPIFIYQKIPGSNPLFQGGNAYFYGMRASVALTDRWSITLNELGGVTIDPSSDSGLSSASGLAEIHLGPKFTFIRNCETGTAMATGLIFEIPAGAAKVFQDTGDFSMVPYLSFAQNFGRSSYGTFNFMDTLGYSFQLGSGRSDFFYNSAHIDYDVANYHHFFPMLEMNWFHYTTSGGSRPIEQEGEDLANIGGSNITGRDYFSIAPGFRYKFSEQVQFGIATEFPLVNPKDLNEFRLLVDFIFRY